MERKVRSADPESIGSLPLTGYTYNALTRGDPYTPRITTITELMRHNERQIIMRRGIGKNGLADIKAALADRGLVLRSGPLQALLECRLTPPNAIQVSDQSGSEDRRTRQSCP